jgi:hypothetical protein
VTSAAPPRPRDTRRRRARAPRRRRRLLVLLAAVVAAALVVVLVVLVSGGGNPAVNYRANGVAVYGHIGPEGIPLEVGPALATPNAKLTGAPVDTVQCLGQEQLAYHVHMHLAIFVNGQPRAVPLGVGMQPPVNVTKSPNGPFATGGQCFYWLHVHAQDGIVHIESPTTRNYVLGQFFGIWGQPLSSTQVGPAQGPVTATVNGRVWDGDPSEITLSPHAQVVLNVGGPVIRPPAVSFGGTGL